MAGDMEDSSAASTIAMMLQMAADPWKCQALVQDDACLGGLVLILSDKNDTVVLQALETLQKLAEKPAHRPRMASFLGMMEQLNGLAEHSSVAVQHVACELRSQLQAMSKEKPTPGQPVVVMRPPRDQQQKGGSQQKSGTEVGKKGRRNSMCVRSNLQNSKTFTLHIRGMHDRDDMELCKRMLLEVKGVISITFDFRKKYSIMRVRPDLKIELLAQAVARTQTMVAEKVTKDDLGNVLIETIDLSSLNDSDGYPDFGDDDDSPQRAGTTVTRMGATKKKQGWGFLSTVGEFISSSFYW